MKRILPLLLTCIVLTIAANAQDFPYGTFSQEELKMKTYVNDTSAHALVLREYGTATIQVTNADEIRLVYTYHVKIKIFDNEGVYRANVALPIYSDGDQNYEKIEDIKGVTTSIDGDGQVKKTELNSDKIFTIKDDKHFSTVKFAMPGIRSGCIVEYKYTMETPYIQNFHSWLFQAEIPKVYSEYEIHIPAFWNYNASIRGSLKLAKTVADVEKGCFTLRGATCDCSHFIYAMKDIPALIEEDYMTSPRNFLAGIYFEMSDYTNIENGANIKLAKEWKDVDYEFKHADYFGSQLKRKGLLADKIAPVIAGKTDSLEKAKAVYAYIQKNMKWNGNNDYGSVDGIRQALNNHSGNAGDINLALAAALYAAGFSPDAVMLSTREHGLINRLYPAVGEFDYVIAKVDIGGKSYLLDATDPELSFGMLPLRCLNDQGRAMSLDKPSYWVDLETKQKENNTYLLDLTLQPDGKMKGSMTHYSLGYAAYLKRKEIKKFNSVDEYVESLDEKDSKFKILSSEVTNLDSLDLPVSEKYEIEIDEFKDMDRDKLGFNPFILDWRTTNPFKLAERSYPVDWGMPSMDMFTLTMHLPAEYVVDTPPQTISIALPNKGGSFVTLFETADNNTFTFSHVVQFSKSTYSPEEYPYLKELYNRIILSEKEKIIFKKK
jgi:hypothetical protein